MPLRLTLCGLSDPSLVMEMAPVLLPTVVGVNVTFKMHDPLGNTLAPQLSVTAKSPLGEILVRLRVALPVLVRVTVCAALVLPTLREEKVSEVGLSKTAGAAIPLPLRLTE